MIHRLRPTQHHAHKPDTFRTRHNKHFQHLPTVYDNACCAPAACKGPHLVVPGQINADNYDDTVKTCDNQRVMFLNSFSVRLCSLVLTNLRHLPAQYPSLHKHFPKKQSVGPKARKLHKVGQKQPPVVEIWTTASPFHVLHSPKLPKIPAM